MADYGIKISREGVDVKQPVTDANAKGFQLLSSKDCLIKKEYSATPSGEFMFWGVVEDNGKIRSSNSIRGSAPFYLIFGNRFDE